MKEREIRQKDLKIKYDKKDLKCYCLVCIITGIITVLVWIPVLLYGGKSIKETPAEIDTMVSITVLLAPFLAVVWTGLILKTLEVSGYLKRLERYGYMIPESAKDYGNMLENLIQDREICRKQGEEKSKVSIALTVAAVIATAFVIYTNFVFTRVPHIWSILFHILLIGRFALQISSRRYRDDVDIYGDPKRRVRRNLNDGLIEIGLLFVVITVFFVFVPDAFPGKVKPVFYRQAIRYEKEYCDKHGFFPDSLPDEATDVLIRMTYEQMGVSFYTSEGQINEYMELYENMENGIGHCSSDEREYFEKYMEKGRNHYLDIPKEMEIGDNCYLYRFKKGFVFINRDSGYVAMYGSAFAMVWD